jgi:ABC-type multidrug transport system ATPase subunit
MLVADSVAKSFGGRRVLSSAFLRVAPGEVRALLGRNGAGKSTLLRIAAGITTPDAGLLFVDDEPMMGVKHSELARRGLLYWPPRSFFSSALRVRDQLEFFRAEYPARRVSVNDVAAALGIEGAIDRKVHTLSGGERRKVELAAVLLRAPRWLLADEPLRGIDPRERELVGTQLRALARAGTGVVVTGHDVSDLLEISDRVTMCVNGTTQEGDPSRCDVWG